MNVLRQTMAEFKAALDLMRRLPPRDIEKNLGNTLALVPMLVEDLLSAVDQVLPGNPIIQKFIHNATQPRPQIIEVVSCCLASSSFPMLATAETVACRTREGLLVIFV